MSHYKLPRRVSRLLLADLDLFDLPTTDSLKHIYHQSAEKAPTNRQNKDSSCILNNDGDKYARPAPMHEGNDS